MRMRTSSDVAAYMYTHLHVLTYTCECADAKRSVCIYAHACVNA